MAAPWLQNLLQSPGFATAIGQFGSQMLAAPDFSQGLAGLGQLPGHLQALKAEDDLRQAEERRRKAEERLAALRIARGETENQMLGTQAAALPGQLADEATARGLNIAGLEETQGRERRAYEAAAGYEPPPGVPPGQAEIIRSNPTLAAQVTAGGMPPTPFEREKYEGQQGLAQRQFDAEMAYRATMLERQRQEVEQRTKKAEQEAALSIAHLDREGYTIQAKMLEKSKEAWLETHDLVGREKWTEEENQEWESFRAQEVDLMNKYEKSMKSTRLLLGAEPETEPSPKERPIDPRLVTVEVAEKIFGGDTDRAAQLMTDIQTAGLWPEVQKLIRLGKSTDQAVEEVVKMLGGGGRGGVPPQAMGPARHFRR